jgi:hypothetical protein
MIGDLDIDLRHEGPRFRQLRLSAQDRKVLGPLAKAKTQSDDPADVLEGLYERAAPEVYSGDPRRVLKALTALLRAYQILIDEGYPFQPLLDHLKAGFDELAERWPSLKAAEP